VDVFNNRRDIGLEIEAVLMVVKHPWYEFIF